MFDPLDFYKSYLVDHFLYKVTTLKNIYDNYGDLKESVLAGLDDVNDNDYLSTLKAEIRANYFQAVETLFEMIFALEPEDGQLVDKLIWYRLSTSNFRKTYERIGLIAKGDTKLLDKKEIVINWDDETPREVSLLEYVFFFDKLSIEFSKEVDISIPGIRKALVLFAEDFSDRDEYNAIKHTVRVFPTVSSFRVGPSGTGEFPVKFDMSGSMTYLKKEKDGSVSLYTKPFDIERDCNMTSLCGQLLGNIVRARRARFFPNEKTDLLVAMPTMADVEEMSKPHVKFKDMKFNFTFEITGELGDAKKRES